MDITFSSLPSSRALPPETHYHTHFSECLSKTQVHVAAGGFKQIETNSVSDLIGTEAREGPASRKFGA
jgi:hypothetical protein